MAAMFEGLIAELLTELTGRRFRLAKSGSQAGRDMSSRQIGANIIAVECKRYNETTALNERELQGELAQAIQSIPDLDLWVLVTSRSIPSQLDEALDQQARRENIGFSSISAGDATPSSLEVLCASSPDVVLKYAAAKIPQDQ